MSTLWTPGGEHPVGQTPPAEPSPTVEGAGGAAAGRAEPAAGRAGTPPSADEEAMAQQVAAMRAELARSPAEVVIANHCYGMFELAAVYLSEQPARLEQARLAIDALGYLVEGLGGRLGETEPQLKEALSQMRLAYVQIEAAQRAGADATSGAAANGGGGGSEASEASSGTGEDGGADLPNADG